MGSASSALAAAHKVMEGGDKFSASVNKQAGVHRTAPAEMSAYSHARAARPANPEGVHRMTTGEDIAAGLAAKQKNIGDYVKATSDQ